MILTFVFNLSGPFPGSFALLRYLHVFYSVDSKQCPHIKIVNDWIRASDHGSQIVQLFHLYPHLLLNLTLVSFKSLINIWLQLTTSPHPDPYTGPIWSSFPDRKGLNRETSRQRSTRGRAGQLSGYIAIDINHGNVLSTCHAKYVGDLMVNLYLYRNGINHGNVYGATTLFV